MIIDGKEYLTTTQAAVILEVSPGRVRQLVADKIITDVISFSKRTLVSAAQVKEYGEGRSEVGRPRSKGRKAPKS